MESYVPIVFHPEFTLRRYHGWRCLEEDPTFQFLEKSQGPFRRQLLLLRGRPEYANGFITTNAKRLEGASELRIYIYPGPAEPPAVRWGNRELRPLTAGRMFNQLTFVSDLSLPEEQLFERLLKPARNLCTQARKDGITAVISESPGEEILARFGDFFSRMARERGLRMPSRSLLDKMSRDGALFSVEAKSASGTYGSILLLYRCGPYAIYLYGASNPAEKKQYGQFLHWEAMRYLKGKGTRWYDLGGVPSAHEDDGIFKFKRSLGGEFVGPSLELLSERGLFHAARRAKELLRFG